MAKALTPDQRDVIRVSRIPGRNAPVVTSGALGTSTWRWLGYPTVWSAECRHVSRDPGWFRAEGSALASSCEMSR